MIPAFRRYKAAQDHGSGGSSDLDLAKPLVKAVRPAKQNQTCHTADPVAEQVAVRENVGTSGQKR